MDSQTDVMLNTIPNYIPKEPIPLCQFAHLGGDKDHEKNGLATQLTHSNPALRHLRPDLVGKFHIAYRGANILVLDALVENAWRLAIRQNRVRQFVDPTLKHISVIVNLGLYSPEGNTIYLVFGLERTQLDRLRRSVGQALAHANRYHLMFKPTGVRAAVNEANLAADTLRKSPRHRDFILHAIYEHGRDKPPNCCPNHLDLPPPPDYSWSAMQHVGCDCIPFFDGQQLPEGVSGREFDTPPCLDPNLDVTSDMIDRCIIFARRNPDFQSPYYSDGVRGTSILIYADPTLPPVMQPHRTLLIINPQRAVWISDTEASTGSLAITLPRTYSIMMFVSQQP